MRHSHMTYVSTNTTKNAPKDRAFQKYGLNKIWWWGNNIRRRILPFMKMTIGII